jgi:hypothetical protein
MQRMITAQAVLTLNFAVGVALVVMLAPHGGKPCDKPAGVRTALELRDKRCPNPISVLTIQALA